MKSVVLAVALTGLMSVTVLAGNIPTNDYATPGNIPTGDVVAPPSPPAGSTSSSVALTNVVLTIITIING